MMGRNRIQLAVAALCVALAAVSCGNDDGTTEAQSTAAAVADETPAATEKVSANNATAAELEAALEAAGVENAEKWAEEIEEYRPYDESDVHFVHLREELSKYGPSQETLNLIVSVLKLP